MLVQRLQLRNGYGRNFLIPQGHAIIATSSAMKVLAENLKQRAFKEKKIINDANKMAEALRILEIKLIAKATEGASAGDKLFGSITKTDLVEAFEKEGQTIDKKFITIIGGNIKRLGQYNAVIRLHREVTVELPFEVIAQA